MLHFLKSAYHCLSKGDNCLCSRSIKAGLWRIVSYLAEIFLCLISSLVLTRFLSPEAFRILAVPFEYIIHAFPIYEKPQVYAYTSIFQAVLLLFFGLLGDVYWDLGGLIAGVSLYRIFSMIPMLAKANRQGGLESDMKLPTITYSFLDYWRVG